MKFTAKITHSSKTVTAMSLAQYNVFSFKKKVAILVAALALILLSIITGGGAPSIVSLFLGCWLLVCVNFPARQTARATERALKGKYPTFIYYFEENQIVILVDGKRQVLEFSDIYSFAEDKRAFYLFVNELSSFMVPKASLDPCSADDFRSYISSLSGKRCKNVRRLVDISLRTIIQDLRSFRSDEPYHL